MNIYVDHWLYRQIPCHRNQLVDRPCWQKISWAIFGNDDDGIFGEGPHSGSKWTKKWGGNSVKGCYHNPGTLSFKRFVLWQLRNPLHNFTAYAIGFKGKKDVSYRRIFQVSTAGIRGYKKIEKPNVFPMEDRTGVYLGLHNKLPFISARVNLFGKGWLETYSGWRPNGGFGLATFRFKKQIKVRKHFTAPIRRQVKVQ